MNISRINEIFVNRGAEAALETAKAAMMSGDIIRHLQNGTFRPHFKPQPAVARHRANPSLKQATAPRVGKTAKSGGLTASLRRKRCKAEASRELLAIMKSSGGKQK
jgi:hypothetical protein